MKLFTFNFNALWKELTNKSKEVDYISLILLTIIFDLLLLNFFQILCFDLVLDDKVPVTFIFPVEQYNMEKKSTLLCIFVVIGQISNKKKEKKHSTHNLSRARNNNWIICRYDTSSRVEHNHPCGNNFIQSNYSQV